MHICYLITRAEMGGSQTHLLDLLDGFRNRFRITLATGEEGFLTEKARALNIDTYVLPNLVQPLRPGQDAKALGEIVALLRSTKPSLVHCHTSKAGILGRFAARITNTPAVFTAHTWSFADGTSKLWKLVGTPSERLAASFTSKIIAVSESNRQLAIHRRVVHPDKIVTVHNGIADTKHRSQPFSRAIPRVIMVARFAPQKNQAQLLEALAGIDRSQPFHLTFVGDGPTKAAAEALARELNLHDRTTFAGVRTDTDRLLAESDIFVLSTNWEGFPITILEAMRAGLPVVATDVDGVREAVLDGVTGSLVAKGNTQALLDKLQQLLTNPELSRRQGQEGRRRYEQEFTHSAMLARVESVYCSIVPGAKHQMRFDSEAVAQ